LYTYKKENAWQAQQSDFILKRRKKLFLQKFVRRFLMIFIPSLLILGGFYFLDLTTFFKKDIKQWISPPAEKPKAPKPVLSKIDLKGLIRGTRFLNAQKEIFFVDTQDKSYTITTSLNTRLQKMPLSAMNRLKTLDRGKPQRIAIIAMDPSNGSLVGMAGFDLADPQANPCTVSDYPAASIIKIITASAAIDSLGYTAQTPLYFNGNKYTLYKRQLTEVKNKYTTKTSLARAFAESINPVFGKIGKNYLGRKKLNSYAHAFGFNQDPDSELEFESGRFSVTESDYHLAELGCGFNRETMISPIFGAMMVTTILNSGTSLVPHIVNQVATGTGEIIYKSKKEFYKTAITPKTADTMIQLMQSTVSRGTAKKSFRGFSKDKILSKLIIGGKTGSLYNRERTVKYDWFTGFGKEKIGEKALAVAIVVGHKKYIGTRASAYAKMILKNYFKDTPVTTAQLDTKKTN
jgi:peptidoglycan glycosyltransferase